MTEHHRRRIDQVLAEEFCEDLASLELDPLRQRRDLAEEVERQLSYYRRLFHGRLDLVAFELGRRRGQETRTLMEALPDILAAGLTGGQAGSARHLSVELELPEITGRREVDQILEADAMTRVTTMSEAELIELQDALADIEGVVSEQRGRLHQVIDRLQAEIIDRYKRGLAQADAPA
ncbi:hypothetical protein BH23ACT5_BH23ACT5_12020 [soil metagenome]